MSSSRCHTAPRRCTSTAAAPPTSSTGRSPPRRRASVAPGRLSPIEPLEPWREPRGTGLAARRLFNSIAVIQYLHHYQYLRQELRWLSTSRGALERSGATRNAL